MPTIAELQINVDSKPISEATKSLNDFASASDKAAKAGKDFSKDTTGGGGLAPVNETTKVKNLSEAIDSQTKKLAELAGKRKLLESSGMKTSAPEEYKRLNSVIDANIALVSRQGNAVDALNIKQGQDFLRREAQVNAEVKAQDRLVKQSEAQARAVSTAAAQQNAQIDATIAGLDKQVKAQLQYNQTIEQLNKARVTGKDGSMSGGMSSGEYEHWVKVAEARRQAAFALEDNSKEVTRSTNKLAQMEATLGKIERAEFNYAKAVATLNDNLEKGTITTDQYDAKLGAFASKRDRAIKAANDNTAAEARFASQLQAVVGAYDPVQRAQDQYAASVKVLKKGLDEGKISQEAYNKALAEQKAALEKVNDASKGNANLADQYQDALKDLIPYRKELDNLAERERILQAQKAAGKVTTAQQIADYDQATAAIQRQRKEYEKRIKAGEAAGITFKQEQAAMRGLPAQFTDIVVSLQGGQAPLTVLLQQGGQIKDMFGGIMPALSAVGRGLLAIINPATLAAAAIALIGYNAYQGSQELNEFNKAVVQSGGYSGTSASQFSQYREQIAAITGNAGQAAEALTLMEKSGKITGDMFVQIGTAAINMQKATGQAIQSTVDDFASLAKDPVNAVMTLDDKYKFLTSSVLAQVDALVKQGDIQGAVTLAQSEMATATADMAKKMVENLGFAERAWNTLKGVVMDTGSAIAAIGREDTTADQITQIENAEKKLTEQLSVVGFFGSASKEDADALIAKDPRLKAYAERKKQLKLLLDLEKFGAQQTSDAEKSRQAAVTSQNRINTGASAAGTPVEKARKELEKAAQDQKIVLDDAAKRGQEVTKQQLDNYAKYKTDLERKLNEAIEAEAKKGKPKNNPLDTREIQDVKSNLSVITSEYDAHYKKVTALGDANVVSNAATAASQKAILDAEAKAINDSYNQQIDAINKLKGAKGLSAAQGINLDNQLTRAQDAQLKAQQDIAAKREAITIKELADRKKMEESILAYNEAYRQQIENEQIAGARAVAAVGKGDRQGRLNQDLDDVARLFAKDQANLAKQRGKGMDPEEYAKKLKILSDAHSEMKDVIIQNDKDIQAANYDWTNGLSRAIDNLADEANNMAGAVDTAVSGAFGSMGDAMGEFVTTGKLNFKSLTSSILSDMAKIAARQATSSVLSSLFGMASTAAGAYFGSGNGLSGAAATSSNLGASQAGYGNAYFPQAKGGGWSGGTQFFAQGGAFTNSIVSSPTAFGMSGGGRGVMGEAGPEAIVPLARASDGSLGVRMMGGGNGGASGGVQVFVNIASDGSVTSTSDNSGLQQFGSELGAFVDSRYRVLISRDLKDGGAIKTAIK